MTILPRAATAGEQTKIRSDNQSSRFYLTAHIPATIYTARLAAVPDSTDRVSSITYNTGSGTHTDILADMTMYVGTTAGAYDVGMVRIRNTTGIGAVTGTFEIGRVSEIDWPANAYLTVVDEFAIMPRWPETDDNGVVAMDTDVAYVNQHRYCASVPIFQRYSVKWLPSGGTVIVNRDGSQSWALNNTINSYLWAAPGNIGTTGVTNSTIAITYDTASPTAGHRISLTVGNTDGVSFTGYGRVFILASEDDAITQFSIDSISGDYNSGGWSAQITCYAQASTATIRDRALVIIHRRDWYGLNAASEGSIGYVADDENIEMIGWIDGESIQWGADDRYSTVTFRIEGPQFWLDKITMPTVGLKNISSFPTNWKRFQGLTAKSATWHTLMWRTTAPRAIDCFSIENGWAALQLQSGGAQTVWQQLSNILNDFLLGAPCCDAYARLFLQREQQTLTTAERSAIPTVLSITKGDWANEIDFERREVNQVAVVDLTGEIYNGTNTSTAVYSLSPGRVFSARGSTPFSRTNLTVDAQATLNGIAGAVFGWQNNPYPDWRFVFPSNLHLIDIAPYQYLDIDIASTDTPRAISETNLRLIPRHIERIFHDGIIETEVTFEAEGAIGLGITGDTPASPPEIPVTPPPLPTPPPAPIPHPSGNAREKWFATSQNRLYYSLDYMNGGDPTWNEISSLPITMTRNSTTIFSPAFLITRGGVAFIRDVDTLYASTNPKAITPTWTKIFETGVTTAAGYLATGKIYGLRITGDVLSGFVKINATGDSWAYGEYAAGAWTWTRTLDFNAGNYDSFGYRAYGVGSLTNTYELTSTIIDSSYAHAYEIGRIAAGTRYGVRYVNGGAAQLRIVGGADVATVAATGFTDSDASNIRIRTSLAGATVTHVGKDAHLWLSSDGAAFADTATWGMGWVDDTSSAGGGTLDWTLSHVVNSNVPMRLYNRDGSVLRDMTGNFWSLASGDVDIYGAGLVFV